MIKKVKVVVDDESLENRLTVENISSYEVCVKFNLNYAYLYVGAKLATAIISHKRLLGRGSYGKLTIRSQRQSLFFKDLSFSNELWEILCDFVEVKVLPIYNEWLNDPYITEYDLEFEIPHSIEGQEDETQEDD